MEERRKRRGTAGSYNPVPGHLKQGLQLGRLESIKTGKARSYLL